MKRKKIPVNPATTARGRRKNWVTTLASERLSPPGGGVGLDGRGSSVISSRAPGTFFLPRPSPRRGGRRPYGEDRWESRDRRLRNDSRPSPASGESTGPDRLPDRREDSSRK